MNWVDGTIIGIVVLSALLGIRRGFLAGAAELAALALGFGAAFLLFRPVGAYIARTEGLKPGLAELGAFLVLWVAVQLIAWLVFHFALRRVSKETTRSPLNRVLGIVPAVLKGIVGAALVVTLLSVSPSGTAARDVKASRLAGPMVATVVRFEASAYNTFKDVIGDLQTSIGRERVVEGYKKLPFQTTDVETDPMAEEQMLDLVNRARQDQGLQPLQMDEELRTVARLHSKDMLARGYFSHVAPDGKSPFDRMHAAGITYRLAGENLAFALTVEVAHEGLMESPGHRKNILTPEYRHVGIGAVRAGARGIMFTQNFTN